MSEKLTIQDKPTSTDLTELERGLERQYEVAPENHEAQQHVVEAVEQLSVHPIVLEQPGRAEIIDPSAPSPETMAHPQALRMTELNQQLSQAIDKLYETQGDIYKDPLFIATGRISKEYEELLGRLSWDEMSANEADTTLRDLSAIQAKRSVFCNSTGKPFYGVGRDVGEVTTILPQKIVEGIYRQVTNQEEGTSFLQDLIAEVKLNKEDSLAIFEKAYRTSGGMDTLKRGQDKIYDAFVDYHKLSPYELASRSIIDAPEDLSAEGILQYEVETCQRMERIMCDQFGLSEDTFKGYLYAAGSRLNTEPQKRESSVLHMSGLKVRERLERIKKAVAGASPEIVEYLADNIGLVNIDQYNGSELNLMRDLVANDEDATTTLERLRSGDTTVIFVDAYGDYNGAFENILDSYDNGEGRVLLFEVKSPGDFYRRMILLKSLNIKPSNIVLGAHGNPGRTSFGNNPATGFGLISDSRSEATTPRDVFLDQASLDKLFGDEFMQPGQDGTRKLIINSCSSAVENRRLKSVAESAAQTIDRFDIKVYGAKGVSFVEGQMDEDGVTYYSQDEWLKRNKNVTTEFTLGPARGSEGKPPVVNSRRVESIKLDERKAA